MTLRILVSGSRRWTNKRIIARAFIQAIDNYGTHLIIPDGFDGYLGPTMLWHHITVVHGAAQGADTIAADIASAWGMHVEPHPADWDKYGHSAGHRRNAAMVKLGADVLLAFPLGESRGTRGCVLLATAAGIPVQNYEPETTP